MGIQNINAADVTPEFDATERYLMEAIEILDYAKSQAANSGELPSEVAEQLAQAHAELEALFSSVLHPIRYSPGQTTAALHVESMPVSKDFESAEKNLMDAILEYAQSTANAATELGPEIAEKIKQVHDQLSAVFSTSFHPVKYSPEEQQVAPTASLKVMATDDYTETILDAMARAFFVSAWANWEDEYGDTNLAGVELMDVAPETEKEAIDAAAKLYTEIEQINNIDLGEFIPPGFTESNYDDSAARVFGHYLAMEAMGHGVSWSDDHEAHGLNVPYLEFSFLDLDPDKYPVPFEGEASIRVEAPGRPPKDWWDKMEKKVKSGNPGYSQEQVDKTIGDIWHNKMSESKKREEVKKEGQAAFPNLFSTEAKKWMKTQTQILAAGMGPRATPEQAAAFVDKAAQQVIDQITKSVPNEIAKIIELEKDDILDNLILEESTEVGPPAHMLPENMPLEEIPVGAAYIPRALKNAFKKKKADDFMQKQVEHGTWVMVDGHQGIEWIPADLVDLNEVSKLIEKLSEGKHVELLNTSLRDYVENVDAWDIDIQEGFGARLSAPGYMDATPWTVFDTETEAQEYLEEMYGD
jgi:hypothetical protein